MFGPKNDENVEILIYFSKLSNFCMKISPQKFKKPQLLKCMMLRQGLSPNYVLDGLVLCSRLWHCFETFECAFFECLPVIGMSDLNEGMCPLLEGFAE